MAATSDHEARYRRKTFRTDIPVGLDQTPCRKTPTVIQSARAARGATISLWSTVGVSVPSGPAENKPLTAINRNRDAIAVSHRRTPVRRKDRPPSRTGMPGYCRICGRCTGPNLAPKSTRSSRSDDGVRQHSPIRRTERRFGMRSPTVRVSQKRAQGGRWRCSSSPRGTTTRGTAGGTTSGPRGAEGNLGDPRAGIRTLNGGEMTSESNPSRTTRTSPPSGTP